MTNTNNRAYKHTEVRMGSWAAGQNEEILETRGLTLCIGVGVHDTAQNSGWLLHSSGPLAEIDMVEGFFNDVKAKLSHPDDVKVWVRGNYITYASGEMVADALLDRKYIEEKTSELVSSSSDIRWGDISIDMLIDCHDGRFIDAPTVYTPRPHLQPLGLRYLAAVNNGIEFTELDIAASRNAYAQRSLDQFMSGYYK